MAHPDDHPTIVRLVPELIELTRMHTADPVVALSALMSATVVMLAINAHNVSLAVVQRGIDDLVNRLTTMRSAKSADEMETLMRLVCDGEFDRDGTITRPPLV